MPAGKRSMHFVPLSRALALAGVVCALAMVSSGCGTTRGAGGDLCWLEDRCQAPPLQPDANPTQLPVGAVLEGGLHCDEGDCQDWYRVGVVEGGPIEIEVQALDDGEAGKVSLVLLDDTGATLVQPEQPSQRIEHPLPAGSYQLGVITVGTRGAPLRYSVVARRHVEASAPSDVRASRMSGGAVARRAWSPGRSHAGWIHSDVIEVDADSVGILIDAGTSHGLRTGQRGELVQAGRTIARIELVEVYEAGSRARLLAPVTRPIDPLTTEARIHVAPASRAR
jgi:hypothetical protein